VEEASDRLRVLDLDVMATLDFELEPPSLASHLARRDERVGARFLAVHVMNAVGNPESPSPITADSVSVARGCRLTR
jgi:4'-phosphopantetheinyl transferase EntD